MSDLSRFKTRQSPSAGGLAALYLVVFLAACGGSDNSSNARNPSGQVRRRYSSDPRQASQRRGSYVILAKTAISNVTGSMVTGDVGVSPPPRASSPASR